MSAHQDFPWPEDEPSTGDLRDRLISSRQRVIAWLLAGVSDTNQENQ